MTFAGGQQMKRTWPALTRQWENRHFSQTSGVRIGRGFVMTHP
jgi:hypothetical protein